MKRRLGLIVTDASPLITLAAGDALDCLTIPGVPVIIPDMVYLEVAQDAARLGASEIVQWVRRHHGQVEIAPTEVFAEFQALQTINPRARSRGRGEQAALEVLNSAIADAPDLEAVLVYEDGDLRRQRFVRGLPPGVMALSTGDLLFELEAAGRIQSADRILDVAAAAGRNVTALRDPIADEGSRALLRARLRPDEG
jgi:hypothetical protein